MQTSPAPERLSPSKNLHGRQVEAARRRQEALLRLAGNPDDGSLDAAVDAYTRESPWLDVAAGQSQPLAVELARSVRRQIEARVGGR